MFEARLRNLRRFVSSSSQDLQAVHGSNDNQRLWHQGPQRLSIFRIRCAVSVYIHSIVIRGEEMSRVRYYDLRHTRLMPH